MAWTKPSPPKPPVSHPEMDPCADGPDVPMNCGDFSGMGDVSAKNIGNECDPCRIQLNFKPTLDAPCWT